MKVFTESHSGWTTKQDASGGYDIIDENGWALATLHYDYRFTCNATNHHRAALLAAAPELLKALTELSNMYVQAWDRADGGLMMFDKGLERFEKAHYAAQVALSIVTGAPLPLTDDDLDGVVSSPGESK